MQTLTKQTPKNLPQHSTLGLGIAAHGFAFAFAVSASQSSFSFWFGIASYRGHPPGL